MKAWNALIFFHSFSENFFLFEPQRDFFHVLFNKLSEISKSNRKINFHLITASLRQFSPDSLIDLWGSAVVKLSIISPLSVFLTN